MPTTPDHSTTTDTIDLTPHQWQVIALLTNGKSVTAAAEAAGLHRTTIHHWRRTQPQFALALHDTKIDLVDHYRTATQARADKALTALDKLLDDDRTPATVRLKAVLHILNTATTIPAVDPFEAQLEARLQDQEMREHRLNLCEIATETERLMNNSSDEDCYARFPDESIAECEDLEPDVAGEEEVAEEDHHVVLLDKAVEPYDECTGKPSTAHHRSNPLIHHNSSFFDDFARHSTLPADALAEVLARAHKTLLYRTR